VYFDNFYFVIDWLKTRDPAERKRLQIKRRLAGVVNSALKNVLKKDAGKQPAIFYHTSFGAVELDPNSLSIWYFFLKDKDLKDAQSSGRAEGLRKLTLAELQSASYPADALPHVSITFDSDEAVQTSTGGNYSEYLS
jgi:hypothetical protein